MGYDGRSKTHLRLHCNNMRVYLQVKREVYRVYRVLVGKPEGKRPLGKPGVDGWIILGWISRRWDVGIWTGLGWSRIETGGGRL